MLKVIDSMLSYVLAVLFFIFWPLVSLWHAIRGKIFLYPRQEAATLAILALIVYGAAAWMFYAGFPWWAIALCVLFYILVTCMRLLLAIFWGPDGEEEACA
jgi:hypothetical protein